MDVIQRTGELPLTPGSRAPAAEDLLLAYPCTTGVDVHLLGGQLEDVWLQTIGTPREPGIKGLLVETVFLGAWGVDKDLDVVDASPAICRVKAQYTRRARRIILLMDSTKLNKKGSMKIMPLGDVDVLITDSGISDEQRERLARLDLDLVVA